MWADHFQVRRACDCRRSFCYDASKSDSIKLISRFMMGLQGLLVLAHGYADPLIARYASLTTSMPRTELRDRSRAERRNNRYRGPGGW